MIKFDLYRLSSHQLCKGGEPWSWAMQSRLFPGTGALPLGFPWLLFEVGKVRIARARLGVAIALHERTWQPAAGGQHRQARQRSAAAVLVAPDRSSPPCPGGIRGR